MSTEGHVPRAVNEGFTYAGPRTMNTWKCTRCGRSFGMALLEAPKACPCCGVTFTQIQIGDVVTRVG
jgi:rubrerythrin